MYESAQQARTLAGANAAEEDRAVLSSMTELADACGVLETEARRLARRIALAIPGGSPFDALDKQAGQINSTGIAPAPCRSHLTEQLQSRIFQLRALANAIGGMAERVEL